MSAITLVMNLRVSLMKYKISKSKCGTKRHGAKGAHKIRNQKSKIWRDIQSRLFI